MDQERDRRKNCDDSISDNISICSTYTRRRNSSSASTSSFALASSFALSNLLATATTSTRFLL